MGRIYDHCGLCGLLLEGVTSGGSVHHRHRPIHRRDSGSRMRPTPQEGRAISVGDLWACRLLKGAKGKREGKRGRKKVVRSGERD